MKYMLLLSSDISIAVVDLLQEMTDVDTLTDSDEGANLLVDALVGVITRGLTIITCASILML